MALIKCPECKGKVSSEAPVCPHCGYPIKPQPVVYAPAPDAPAEPADAADMPPSYPGKPFHWSDRVPVAFLLFWGGLIVGMLWGGGDLVDNLNSEHGVQSQDRTFIGWIAWAMIVGGIGWFVKKNYDSYLHFRRWKAGVEEEMAAKEAENAAKQDDEAGS